jgi:predicted nucleic acid-binding protein
MIVLDTNVVSEGDKTPANPNVLRWLKWQNPLNLFLCAPVAMEQIYGAERFHHRTGSSRHLANVDQMILGTFKGRILPFDGEASVAAGRLRAERDRSGRPISIPDAMIAAICRVHGATLATRNVRDFDGLNLKLVNPFEPAA